MQTGCSDWWVPVVMTLLCWFIQGLTRQVHILPHELLSLQRQNTLHFNDLIHDPPTLRMRDVLKVVRNPRVAVELLDWTWVGDVDVSPNRTQSHNLSYLSACLNCAYGTLSVVFHVEYAYILEFLGQQNNIWGQLKLIVCSDVDVG